MPRVADLSAVRLVFASGTQAANRQLVEHYAVISPPMKLFIVAEFQPASGEWIPWHVLRGLKANLKSIRAALAHTSVDTAAFLLTEHAPLSGMKYAAMRCGAKRVVALDDEMREIPLSLAGVPAWIRHSSEMAGHFLRVQFAPGGRGRKWLKRIAHPSEAEIPFLARKAQLYGAVLAAIRGRRREFPMQVSGSLLPGVSVVIPSRDGAELLKTLFPSLLHQVEAGEVIVSDNGSSDGTLDWLAENHPSIRVIRTAMPLSFARAVNLGILQARYSHVFLLNNDMVMDPGCIAALTTAFRKVPDLFCATAQIFFPEGIRREETGKAVWRTAEALDFPVRCDEPVEGEDLTWVLYGSGGCSLFDTQKLRALGGVAEVYDPAYVEDMDFGYRAWKRGWPSVYCSGAKVEHRHRATTLRFYSEERLQFFVERNYLRFLIYAIGEAKLFGSLWNQAIRRLQLLAMRGDAYALETLRNVPRIAALPEAAAGPLNEEAILALGNGDVAVFPGKGLTHDPIVIVSPYMPYPLSHGGAVRIFNLMREGAKSRGQILVCFVDRLAPVPRELLDFCTEVVLVQRHGSHYRKDTELPDGVEEFCSLTFEAALRLTVMKWQPKLVQLEFTQMAQYSSACQPARTVLVEHDITFDLMEQLLTAAPQSEIKRLELSEQLRKWKHFETKAWREVNCIVAMSEKDRDTAAEYGVAVCIPNGVDTERFEPSLVEAEPKRLLFVGSFQHLPNQLGLAWFLHHVWPILGPEYRLHVIAGIRHEFYRDFYRERVQMDLSVDRVEVDGFISDIRPSYRRAQIVIVPLIASAGTNIKVLEAMAMGKPVVSTGAGVNGLDLGLSDGVAIASSGEDFAAKIQMLASDSGARLKMEHAARITAVQKFDWTSIANRQSDVYRKLEN